MKLYRMYNGYMGNSSVCVLVIAETPLRAAELAKEAFKKYGEEFGHHESYWEAQLDYEVLSEDTSKEWAYEPED